MGKDFVIDSMVKKHSKLDNSDQGFDLEFIGLLNFWVISDCLLISCVFGISCRPRINEMNLERKDQVS